MSFENCMKTVLPPLDGVEPHISGSVFNSYRNRPRTNNKHCAVDFNYKGGQAFNRKHIAPVHSPVSGTIEGNVGGQFGIVNIRDTEGNLHGFLHMVNICVKSGQSVSAGTKLGRMCGKGANGPLHYDVHVHYQLRDKKGVLVDPVAFWDNNKQVYTAPLDPEDENPHETDPYYDHQEPASPVGTVEEYMPRQAAVSENSKAAFALWTNRVPMHEPWPRTMMVNTEGVNGPSDEIDYNVNHAPQLEDDNEEGAKLIGKLEGEEEIPRGKFWRR